VTNSSEISFLNPPGYEIDFDLLQEFEGDLNPFSPETCRIPCRVLGYGEISTVFEIQSHDMHGLAFKRMSIFETQDELKDYLITYKEYNRLLEEEINVQLPSHGHAVFVNTPGRPIFYIIQKMVHPSSIGNKAIHLLPRQLILVLFKRALQESHKVWAYNELHPDCQLGIDGQISNWSIDGFDPQNPYLDERTPLSYLDTSTPLLCLDGIERLDPELLLRAAPSFLVWILRLLFLEDVMTRYYDPRKVVVDMIANFYKEQRPDLIDNLILSANSFFADEAEDLSIESIEENEVRAYYREDALIWSLYLSMRRFDRFLHTNLLRREYPYILPGKIER
jgi:hypothetical protein